MEYLTIHTGSSISNSVTDIIFLTKMQKGKPPKKGLAFIEITISQKF
jgi:hypothetical protein